MGITSLLCYLPRYWDGRLEYNPLDKFPSSGDMSSAQIEGVSSNEYITIQIKDCANTLSSYRQPTDQFEILLNAVNNGRYARPELLQRGLCMHE